MEPATIIAVIAFAITAILYTALVQQTMRAEKLRDIIRAGHTRLGAK